MNPRPFPNDRKFQVDTRRHEADSKTSRSLRDFQAEATAVWPSMFEHSGASR